MTALQPNSNFNQNSTWNIIALLFDLEKWNRGVVHFISSKKNAGVHSYRILKYFFLFFFERTCNRDRRIGFSMTCDRAYDINISVYFTRLTRIPAAVRSLPERTEPRSTSGGADKIWLLATDRARNASSRNQRRTPFGAFNFLFFSRTRIPRCVPWVMKLNPQWLQRNFTNRFK